MKKNVSNERTVFICAVDYAAGRKTSAIGQTIVRLFLALN